MKIQVLFTDSHFVSKTPYPQHLDYDESTTIRGLRDRIKYDGKFNDLAVWKMKESTDVSTIPNKVSGCNGNEELIKKDFELLSSD